MAIRLASRTKCPPGGFVYFQPQTSWDSTKAVPASQWDFKLLVKAVQAHRRANPRFKLATDLETISYEVDVANAMRVRSIPKAESYVVEDTAPFPAPIPKAQGPLGKLVAVAGASVKYAAGAKLFYDWLGEGGKPVEHELANARARVCEGCPKNEQGDWRSYFTEPVIAAVTKQIEQRQEMRLSTPSDDTLGVCGACLCVLRLKVHTPFKHIIDNMPETVKKELDPRCWVLFEK